MMSGIVDVMLASLGGEEGSIDKEEHLDEPGARCDAVIDRVSKSVASIHPH